jgi:hypothetical protein
MRKGQSDFQPMVVFAIVVTDGTVATNSHFWKSSTLDSSIPMSSLCNRSIEPLAK